MVGGLVEQQHIGRREQQLRQLHAHQPAAAEGGKRPPGSLTREAEPRQHALHARLPLEPPSELEGSAVAVVALGKLRRHLPAGAPDPRHLGLDLAYLVLEVVQVGKHRRHLPPHRPLAPWIDLLVQQPQPHPARHQRSPGVRHLEPHGNPQQRRLAGLGPTNPTRSPRFTVRSTSRNNTRVPIVRATPSNRSSMARTLARIPSHPSTPGHGRGHACSATTASSPAPGLAKPCKSCGVSAGSLSRSRISPRTTGVAVAVQAKTREPWRPCGGASRRHRGWPPGRWPTRHAPRGRPPGRASARSAAR